MPHNTVFSRVFICAVFLLLVPGPYPAVTTAQPSMPEFEALSLSFWPEYDRLDVLVIYHIRLSAETELPAQVRLRLPPYLEGLHALAIERDGRLLNVDPKQIEWTRDEEAAWLSFPATSQNIQLEYYDPVLLTKQAQARSIEYLFTAPAAIDSVAFRLQHPLGADGVTLDIERRHEELEQYSNRDGLQYSMLKTVGIEEGESFDVSMSYKRTDGTLSSRALQTPPPVQAETPTPESDAAEENNPLSNSLYLFVGAAAASLIWWLRDIGKGKPSNTHSPEEPAEDDQ